MISVWVKKIPWRRKWIFLPGKFYGQKSLAGYSPRACKESDMTEQLTHTHTKQKEAKWDKKYDYLEVMRR